MPKVSKALREFRASFVGPPTLHYFRSVHSDLYNEYVKLSELAKPKTCSVCGESHPRSEYATGGTTRSVCRLCYNKAKNTQKKKARKERRDSFIGPPKYGTWLYTTGYATVSYRKFRKNFIGPRTKAEVHAALPELAAENKRLRNRNETRKAIAAVKPVYVRRLLVKSGCVKNLITEDLIVLHTENILIRRAAHGFCRELVEMSK